ncbi:sensor histidine kinase [Pedobacter sp. L105]|uniref:sensor histidine kinase n=1 Tax=Pedobacter sp. L105 TaxID=1641871 RepID=UPI00131BC41E|nr:histidine kinase [Pedobacter sp. L105]
MFKAYQIKWYIVMAGMFTISTLFIRQQGFKEIGIWDCLDYFLRIFSLIFAGWFVHAYFLLHKIPFLRGITKFFVSNLTAIFAIYCMACLLYEILPSSHLITNTNPTKNIISSISAGCFFSIICYSAFYSIHANVALQNSKLENQILEQEHLRAQLLSLQQQISPHFLFNALSTLKTIATDRLTKNYIVQLGTVYRYVLNYNEHYLTPLQEELVFIKSYLYIMDQRFQESLQISIEISDEYLNFVIPPLSLQLLIENAIKHNIISREQPLHILIKTDNSPALIVENNLQLKKHVEDGTGTGLKNIGERYRLLIDKPINISNAAGKFSVTLPLIKDESNHNRR